MYQNVTNNTLYSESTLSLMKTYATDEDLETNTFHRVSNQISILVIIHQITGYINRTLNHSKMGAWQRMKTQF